MALIQEASPPEAVAPTRPARRTLPPALGVGFQGCAGLWHDGDGDVAVVICPPVGREWRCAYLPLRRFAERLADAGYPTLRFDYLGEGESLDAEDPEEDATVRWRASVEAAVAFARQTGARKVVLAGLRLGGALAALAAQHDDPVDGLMLLAPVTTGRGWIRELQLAAAMGRAVFRDPQEKGLVSDDLRLSPHTLRTLKTLKLDEIVSTPRHVLLRGPTSAIDPVAARLRDLGADVAVGDFPGYDALFDEPHSNLPPHRLFDEAIAWLESRFPSVPRVLRTPPPRRLHGAGWTEEAVRFGAGLVGVLCSPDPALARKDAAAFGSTGGDPRSSLGRFAVTAARDLAASGVASLRFDFSGVGDSAAAEGERSHVFETPRQADISAAVDLLAERGFEDITLVGICAGAYHAIRATDAETRIKAIFAVSMQKLVWKTGDTLAAGHQAGATRSYVEGVLDPRNWVRVLRGDVQVRRITRTLLARFVAKVLAPKDPEGERAKRMLAAFSARGGRARFLLGVHDSALDEMEFWFGKGGRQLTALPGASVRLAPRLDHGLSYQESRDIALVDLRVFLGLG